MSTPDFASQNFGFNNVYGFGQSTPSDANGVVNFTSVLFMDALSGCYRVAFITPSSIVSYATALSDPVCVFNMDVVTINTQPAAVTSAGAVLSSPFTVTLTRPYRSDIIDVRDADCDAYIHLWVLFTVGIHTAG